jgi:hypothetical protein
VAQDAAEGLYRLVDAAYEKRSVAISANRLFSMKRGDAGATRAST